MGTKSYVVNTGKVTSKFNSEVHHKRYGIQKWLCSKKFILSSNKANSKYTVDGDKYRELLKEFALHVKPDYDFSKSKDLVRGLESFVQNRFTKFCSFCIDKFKDNG